MHDITPTDIAKEIPGCLHVFHVKCIDTWMESSKLCPDCSKNILD